LSFLDQLKSQASALQSQQSSQLKNYEDQAVQTEIACQRVWHYVRELAKQLTVITPEGPKFSLDGKTSWPAMKLTNFRVDSRKKTLRDKEVYDTIAMGWDIVPQQGLPVAGAVSVNFPPDLERVQKRLAFAATLTMSARTSAIPKRVPCKPSFLSTPRRQVAT
jgi:hypothetical protein